MTGVQTCALPISGGAVRGILWPLCAAGVSAIRILNRTSYKADLIVEQQQHQAISTYTTADAEPFDLIINGTSAGLSGSTVAIPETAATAITVCYDMTYGTAAALFGRWAAAHGAARFADGLGMLVEQAAEAFYIWRRIRPDTRRVIDALRGEETLAGQ